MTAMIEITRQKIDNHTLLPAEADPLTGATVLFLGTAREITGESLTESLEYEAYVEMATPCFEQLAEEAHQRWPIHSLRLIHRLGRIKLGETCVAIVVSCPHRREAFEAASWLMDRIKAMVPIWKKEHWTSGSSQWIHPSDETQTAPTTGRTQP